MKRKRKLKIKAYLLIPSLRLASLVNITCKVGLYFCKDTLY